MGVEQLYTAHSWQGPVGEEGGEYDNGPGEVTSHSRPAVSSVRARALPAAVARYIADLAATSPWYYREGTGVPRRDYRAIGSGRCHDPYLAGLECARTRIILFTYLAVALAKRLAVAKKVMIRVRERSVTVCRTDPFQFTAVLRNRGTIVFGDQYPEPGFAPGVLSRLANAGFRDTAARYITEYPHRLKVDFEGREAHAMPSIASTLAAPTHTIRCTSLSLADLQTFIGLTARDVIGATAWVEIAQGAAFDTHADLCARSEAVSLLEVPELPPLGRLLPP